MYKNDNSVYLRFLIMSPDPYFTSFLFREHNSAFVRNILMIIGRTGQHGVSHARMTNLQISFSNYILLSIFELHFCFRSITPQPLKIF